MTQKYDDRSGGITSLRSLLIRCFLGWSYPSLPPMAQISVKYVSALLKWLSKLEECKYGESVLKIYRAKKTSRDKIFQIYGQFPSLTAASCKFQRRVNSCLTKGARVLADNQKVVFAANRVRITNKHRHSQEWESFCMGVFASKLARRFSPHSIRGK